MSDGQRWRCSAMGEAAVLCEAEPSSDPAQIDLANRRAISLARAFDALAMPGARCCVPAIASVLVCFDPLAVAPGEVAACLSRLAVEVAPAPAIPQQIAEVPVVFGGQDGPDLAPAAQALGMEPGRLVDALCARPYRVMMIGFAMGFPYIGPLPAGLTLPRRATPRPGVPAGSVAIAAGMAGIYPAELPGGWHLVGRTGARLFDPSNQDQPALFRAGDGVQFTPVGAR